MPTLYHYVHCPFCLRVRMSLGYLNIAYESQVLAYDDEKTPVDLCQKKMLPIMSFDDGETLNESLDIILKLDKENTLLIQDFLNSKKRSSFEQWLNTLSAPIHNLVMPYWAYTQEFTPKAREYFLSKKEKKRGPFPELMAKRYEFEKELEPLLDQVEAWIEQTHHTFIPLKISIEDIMLASVLWGLYMLPEFQFSSELHAYLQHLKKGCLFEYHQDFWSS